ncbi:unnamed protein product [Orchesella dallaii]|uniref:Glutamate-gated chloride channel n=1 Tax=Orchesella dallaii TaxID=48710 RepID=A0ABP1R541_9HEXA
MLWGDYKMNLKTVIIIFVFVAVTINETTARKKVNPEGEILERLIPNFNKLLRVRPFSSKNISDPVRVQVNFYVRSMRIVGYDNEFSVQLTFRQQWLDERLSFQSQDSNIRYLTLTNSKNEIWQPDTFFSNEIEGKYHDLMMRNEYIRIFPDGEVLTSIRISLRLSCPMNYQNFPFDTQYCSIRLASYGFTTRDIVLAWKSYDPVEVGAFPASDIQNFELKQFTTDYCDSQTNTGIYSCLRVDLKFQRNFHSYLTLVYIPSMMMVVTSWVSFWITPKAVTARTLIATLTLFVLAIQTAEANNTFPQTSYTKPVDVWTGTCLTFVFVALLEFAIVHYLSNRKENNSSTPARSKIDENAGIVTNVVGEDGEVEIQLKDMSPRDGNRGHQGQMEAVSGLAPNLISKSESSSNILDVVSRIAFPALFILFIILYRLAYFV